MSHAASGHPVTLRMALAPGSLVAGAVVGTAATVVHGRSLGLELALVATFAAVLALPPGWWSRLPFAAGWLGIVFYFSHPRPEGDYLVASNTDGYVLLATGMVVVAFSIITLRPTSPQRPAAHDAGAEVDPS